MKLHRSRLIPGLVTLILAACSGPAQHSPQAEAAAAASAGSVPQAAPIIDYGERFLPAIARNGMVVGPEQLASEVGLPRAINNRFIDAEASRTAIDSRLQEIERIAKTAGHAVGIGSPFPITIDRLVRWVQTLEGKGLALAPVSALVNVQRR